MDLCFRDIAAEETNLELVLTKAFLEVDKALARHLHFSADGRSYLTDVIFKNACMLCEQYTQYLSCCFRVCTHNYCVDASSVHVTEPNGSL